MRNVVLVEDDEQQARIAQDMLQRCPAAPDLHVTWVRTAAEVTRLVEGGTVFHLALLDIDLGEGEPNGMQLATRLFGPGSLTQVIYATGHIEYCTRVYQTAHVYFLAKPFLQADLDDAIDRALQNIRQATQQPLLLQQGSQAVRVLPAYIRYAESKRRKVLVHEAGRVIEVYGSLASLADQLPAAFVQCHKSFLVNLACVASFQTQSLTLLDGTVLPISKSRAARTRQAFFAFARQRAVDALPNGEGMDGGPAEGALW